MRAKRPPKGHECWFYHPDQKFNVQGIYRGRHKVEVMTKFERTAHGFDSESVIYTVPSHIAVHEGQAPK